ncbi:hypothetical protein CK203_099672 [Vitis vinifera]|uniref:Uncharacterized protein n=1 Tax=Vitis vinifera TaxID=29760 RepID=A0A438F1S0_VITVI|nr:hypothetical protein CK203_099672 [Vitis vinifera]
MIGRLDGGILLVKDSRQGGVKEREDKVFWAVTRSGSFSVKSLYFILENVRVSPFPTSIYGMLGSLLRLLLELLFSLFKVVCWRFDAAIRDSFRWQSLFIGRKRKKVWRAAPLCPF